MERDPAGVSHDRDVWHVLGILALSFRERCRIFLLQFVLFHCENSGENRHEYVMLVLNIFVHASFGGGRCRSI
tara:strand:- start:327 stop:545 length:219 start_codon:yes stop_codon:yes gene_type:complete